jgi:8-oxo-dGTP pyrophosphatase MutT (NUDIX family)
MWSERVTAATTALDALRRHPDVARLAASLVDRPGAPLEREGAFRWAAIAVVIRASATGDPEMLMIKRADHEGDPWSGHVACPGGRWEPGDPDLAQTAARETREETAIDVERDGKILGAMDDLTPLTPRLPAIVIRPYVAIVPPTVRIVPSDEVAATFWVPLSTIRDPSAWGRASVDVRGLGKREESVFRYADHLVWGLTERVLRELVDRLEH